MHFPVFFDKMQQDTFIISEQPMALSTNHGYDTIENIDEKFDEPKNYKVIFFNDDYTTKEFVTYILEFVFHKEKQEAEILMETVHRKGSAIVGIYPFDIANTRVAITINMARKEGFPLKCELEEA